MATYYVAPNGNDLDNGSEGAPWASTDASLAKLVANDILILRDGLYREESIQHLSLSDITIEAYPGETPRISMEIEEATEVGNSFWELVDAEKHIWRSVQDTWSFSDTVRGYMEDSQGDGTKFFLIVYDGALTEFESADFFGPGIYRDAAHIYIRLDYPDPAQVDGVFTRPANQDPRQNRIWLAGAKFGFQFSDSTNITLQGIELGPYEEAIALSGTTTNFTLKKSRSDTGRDCINVINVVDGLYIDRCTFDGYVAPWAAWRLHKDYVLNDITHIRFEFTDLNDDFQTIQFRQNHFRNAFDAAKYLGAAGSIRNVRSIGNTYTNIMDDCGQFSSNIQNSEFAYNFGDGSTGPLSWHGADVAAAEPGTVFVHHNIARPGLRLMEYGAPRRHEIQPLHTHIGLGYAGGVAWKMYHNLYIGGGSRGASQIASARNDTGELYEVWNGICMHDDPTHDREVVRPLMWGLSAISLERQLVQDYMCLYRDPSISTLFYRGVIENPDSVEPDRSFSSLASFRASDVFTSSQAYYAPGIDGNSFQADPLLADTAAGDFRPDLSSPCVGAALDLSDRNWSGTRYPADTIGPLPPDDPSASVGVGYMPPARSVAGQFADFSGNRLFLDFDTEQEALDAQNAIFAAMVAEGVAGTVATAWATPRLVSTKYRIPLPAAERRLWLRDSDGHPLSEAAVMAAGTLVIEVM